MRSVLCSVRKRKKARRLGRVDVVRREGYGELELDAKVELIRSLVPLGLMQIEELLDAEVTALAGARYARKDGLTEGRRHGHTPGTVGPRGPARADSRAADSTRRGERDAAAVVCGVARRPCGDRPASETGAVWDLLPQL